MNTKETLNRLLKIILNEDLDTIKEKEIYIDSKFTDGYDTYEVEISLRICIPFYRETLNQLLRTKFNIENQFYKFDNMYVSDYDDIDYTMIFYFTRIKN